MDSTEAETQAAAFGACRTEDGSAWSYTQGGRRRKRPRLVQARVDTAPRTWRLLSERAADQAEESVEVDGLTSQPGESAPGHDGPGQRIKVNGH